LRAPGAPCTPPCPSRYTSDPLKQQPRMLHLLHLPSLLRPLPHLSNSEKARRLVKSRSCSKLQDGICCNMYSAHSVTDFNRTIITLIAAHQQHCILL
jgi:hypothetical protein